MCVLVCVVFALNGHCHSYAVVQSRQEKRVVAHQMSFTLHLGENELDLTTEFPDLLMLNNAKRKVNLFCLAISLLRSFARSSYGSTRYV